MNLQSANVIPLAIRSFLNRQSFKPSIVKGTMGIEVEMAGVGSKRINMRWQFVAN
jgi:hypothetical protein